MFYVPENVDDYCPEAKKQLMGKCFRLFKEYASNQEMRKFSTLYKVFSSFCSFMVVRLYNNNLQTQVFSEAQLSIPPGWALHDALILKIFNYIFKTPVGQEAYAKNILKRFEAFERKLYNSRTHIQVQNDEATLRDVLGPAPVMHDYARVQDLTICVRSRIRLIASVLAAIKLVGSSLPLEAGDENIADLCGILTFSAFMGSLAFIDDAATQYGSKKRNVEKLLLLGKANCEYVWENMEQNTSKILIFAAASVDPMFYPFERCCNVNFKECNCIFLPSNIYFVAGIKWVTHRLKRITSVPCLGVNQTRFYSSCVWMTMMVMLENFGEAQNKFSVAGSIEQDLDILFAFMRQILPSDQGDCSGKVCCWRSLSNSRACALANSIPINNFFDAKDLFFVAKENPAGFGFYSSHSFEAFLNSWGRSLSLMRRFEFDHANVDRILLSMLYNCFNCYLNTIKSSSELKSRIFEHISQKTNHGISFNGLVETLKETAKFQEDFMERIYLLFKFPYAQKSENFATWLANFIFNFITETHMRAFWKFEKVCVVAVSFFPKIAEKIAKKLKKNLGYSGSYADQFEKKNLNNIKRFAKICQSSGSVIVSWPKLSDHTVKNPKWVPSLVENKPMFLNTCQNIKATFLATKIVCQLGNKKVRLNRERKKSFKLKDDEFDKTLSQAMQVLDFQLPPVPRIFVGTSKFLKVDPSLNTKLNRSLNNRLFAFLACNFRKPILRRSKLPFLPSELVWMILLCWPRIAEQDDAVRVDMQPLIVVGSSINE